MTSQNEPLLELHNLTTIFPLKRGVVQAVTGVDLTLYRRGILGLVGESGCGKSVTMLSILRLVPYPGEIVQGQVLYKGQNLLDKPMGEVRQIRGREIAMIFQDPMTTLNPVFKVGEQVRESLRIHGIVGDKKLPWPFDKLRTWPFGRDIKTEEKQRVLKIMKEVGIPATKHRYHEYPHQFSGGMQQRMVIAIALACEPELLLADEPTTALDVTIQAQILDLLREINREHGTSIILVTHDLGVTAEFCRDIAVMYAGQLVEKGTADQVIQDPKHPYTQGLLHSIPRITKERKRIKPIPGEVPEPVDLPEGCAFYPRCDRAKPECRGSEVPMREIEEGRLVRCVRARD
jgi:oligopeptide/dipeptide ABC transporter ATP-binding protein